VDGPRLEGVLERGEAVVRDRAAVSELEARGHGEHSGGRFVLLPSEALYLVYEGRLRLRSGGRRVGFEELVRLSSARDPGALTKFLVYRDLCSRGYVVKDGFGFGSDFRVYERGQFGRRGARYLVFALNEGQSEKIGQLQRKISEITRMGKEPVIAVLERRGEVIYYRMSRASFPQNRR